VRETLEPITEAIELLQLFKTIYIRHDTNKKGCVGCVLVQRVERAIDKLAKSVTAAVREEGKDKP